MNKKITWDMVPGIIEERSMPEPNTGCWLWMSYGNRKDYGQIVVSRVTHGAHRASWTVFKGPIPAGMQVLHKCDTPPCVNPDHLFLGSDLDNVKDRVAKGRSSSSKGTGHHLSKLDDDQVIFIFQSEMKNTVLAKLFGVTRQAIRAIKIQESWRWLTKDLKCQQQQ